MSPCHASFFPFFPLNSARYRHPATLVNNNISYALDMADISPAPRIVPGAPPPPSLSKSQKKKRKSVAKPKLVDTPSAESLLAIPDSKVAPLVELVEEVDVKKDVAGAVVVPPLEPVQEVIQDKSKKASPAVELLNKRIKVQTKKIVSNLMLLIVCGGRSVRVFATMWGSACTLSETHSCFPSLCVVAYTLQTHHAIAISIADI